MGEESKALSLAQPLRLRQGIPKSFLAHLFWPIPEVGSLAKTTMKEHEARK